MDKLSILAALADKKNGGQRLLEIVKNNGLPEMYYPLEGDLTSESELKDLAKILDHYGTELVDNLTPSYLYLRLGIETEMNREDFTFRDVRTGETYDPDNDSSKYPLSTKSTLGTEATHLDLVTPSGFMFSEDDFPVPLSDLKVSHPDPYSRHAPSRRKMMEMIRRELQNMSIQDARSLALGILTGAVFLVEGGCQESIRTWDSGDESKLDAWEVLISG